MKVDETILVRWSRRALVACLWPRWIFVFCGKNSILTRNHTHERSNPVDVPLYGPLFRDITRWTFELDSRPRLQTFQRQINQRANPSVGGWRQLTLYCCHYGTAWIRLQCSLNILGWCTSFNILIHRLFNECIFKMASYVVYYFFFTKYIFAVNILQLLYYIFKLAGNFTSIITTETFSCKCNFKISKHGQHVKVFYDKLTSVQMLSNHCISNDPAIPRISKLLPTHQNT